MNEWAVREKIVELCREINSSGLNQGTSGNISARHEGSMLITPSGVAYEDMHPTHIARMSLDHDNEHWDGPFKPSSEWHFHRAILMTRPELGAVVHTHSMFATVLSIARLHVPACHYMIAAFGGNNVRCADYATFGTPELSAHILQALHHRSACLLANHGMLVAGLNLDKALWAAVELETLCTQYYHASALGNAVILSDEEIARVCEKFRSYGPANAAGDGTIVTHRMPADAAQADVQPR